MLLNYEPPIQVEGSFFGPSMIGVLELQRFNEPFQLHPTLSHFMFYRYLPKKHTG